MSFKEIKAELVEEAVITNGYEVIAVNPASTKTRSLVYEAVVLSKNFTLHSVVKWADGKFSIADYELGLYEGV